MTKVEPAQMDHNETKSTSYHMYGNETLKLSHFYFKNNKLRAGVFESYRFCGLERQFLRSFKYRKNKPLLQRMSKPSNKQTAAVVEWLSEIKSKCERSHCLGPLQIHHHFNQ